MELGWRPPPIERNFGFRIALSDRKLSLHLQTLTKSLALNCDIIACEALFVFG
jgi:hypothetical protein